MSLGAGPGRRTVVAADETPQKAFLRERFKAKCIERAQRSRERVVKGKRFAGSDTSSDGFDEMMDCVEDEDDDDDDVMQDEVCLSHFCLVLKFLFCSLENPTQLFRRIVQNTERIRKHSYRLSYNFEVGSSIDPNMEDVPGWEAELQGTYTVTPQILYH
jgi:hypothetical protein